MCSRIAVSARDGRSRRDANESVLILDQLLLRRGCKKEFRARAGRGNERRRPFGVRGSKEAAHPILWGSHPRFFEGHFGKGSRGVS